MSQPHAVRWLVNGIGIDGRIVNCPGSSWAGVPGVPGVPGTSVTVPGVASVWVPHESLAYYLRWHLEHLRPAVGHLDLPLSSSTCFAAGVTQFTRTPFCATSFARLFV